MINGLLMSAPSMDLHETLRVLDDLDGVLMDIEFIPDIKDVSGVFPSLRDFRLGVFGRYDISFVLSMVFRTLLMWK